CGSGSMLLGVIQLQVELVKCLHEYNKAALTPHSEFLLKKQIISESIYGVDIKEWAVRIAELRFWLYMIADAEFTTEQLTKEPLLPNLDFKLRQGNSLIQEIGSLDFSIKGLFTKKDGKKRLRNAGATRKLNEFIKKKKAFITNQSASNISFKELKNEELFVFKEFLKELIFENNQDIVRLSKGDGQQSIFGDEKRGNLFEDMIVSIEAENGQLQNVLSAINKTGRLPFSFDIDFMEIFLTQDDPGFDLIIGNPPYVRQEDILPADNAIELERLLKTENRIEKAKISNAYKKKLSDRIFQVYPFLNTKAKISTDEGARTINIYGNKVPGRSDLYVYFQLLLPALLNSKGTFCFIISNSWLDVEFGGFVQHFLLKHTQLHTIYDCSSRSFSAAVNTIIYLHSSIINNGLSESLLKSLKPTGTPIRFIMNKSDYTNTAYAPMLIEQENCQENTFREHYRVILKTPQELLEEGFDDETLIYKSDKWGGKYLRAPEIYYTKLLPSINKKIFRLSSLASIEGYIHDNNVGDNFPKIRVILSSQSIETINIKNDYPSIENVGIRKSGNSRTIPHLVVPRTYSEKFVTINNEANILFKRFYKIILNDIQYREKVVASLNSTLWIMLVEIESGIDMGEGALNVYKNGIKKYIVVDIKKTPCFDFEMYERIHKDIFSELGFNKSLPIRSQVPNPLPDRKELDDIIFDELGLTEDERKEVYWATAELVKQRLDKAGSR
ncbi:MAG: hypothetical protein PHT69_16040, partial [Bacteroidales bacterium]|nr:hypothetical protein [Bacteroidales bacterium]